VRQAGWASDPQRLLPPITARPAIGGGKDSDDVEFTVAAVVGLVSRGNTAPVSRPLPGSAAGTDSHGAQRRV